MVHQRAEWSGPERILHVPSSAQAAAWLAEATQLALDQGLEISRVSGGGTPSAFSTHESAVFTEMRAGTYVYGDRSCIADETVPAKDCALVIQATVISRPTRERAILDAGSKTLSSDPAYGSGLDGYGSIIDYPTARIYALSEEHGHVDVSQCPSPPKIGEVVEILPNHACGTIALHDRFAVRSEGEICDWWPVDARGRVW